MDELKIKNVRGTNDYGSEEQILRNFISDTLRKIFEKYGYKPLATSTLCYYDLLALKYDEDNDILNEIYRVADQGNRNLALRYDLTVPFAKYIASNPNLRLPYKRYEIGNVFRDGPIKKGRLREFIQCDIDSVGIEGQAIEAELISLFVDGYSELGIDVIIKYNNRKIMAGLIEVCGIPKEKESQTITIIDKFEKLSDAEIKEEFIKIGIDESKIADLTKYLKSDFETIKANFENTSNEILREGIQEIINLNEYIENLDMSKYVEFSATLARGQEYYTGTVFEVYIADGSVKSSIGGGGRYDKIIGDFVDDGKKYPACGISFGLDVIYTILKERKNNVSSNVKAYIIPMGNKIKALQIARKLRAEDINVDIEMNDKKLRKSLDYCNKENIPFAIIIGEEELKKGKVILKDMEKNEQTEVEELKIGEMVSFAIRRLKK